MTNDGAAVFLYEGIERVARLGVDAIDPGGEQAHAAQLTTVFVRNDVVGVVGPRSVIEKRAERLPSSALLARTR